jgi:branched-chain amino acid transport system substrate-binding protein
MKNRSGRVWSLACGALLSVACMSSASVWADDCEVRIGATGPMTGGAASWGLALKAGTEFQAALANDAGGLQVGNRKCKVKVVSYDAQCNAAGGAAASNYFAGEKVTAVMGPVCSPELTGFRPAAKRNGQVNFTSSYLAGALGPEWPTVFHLLQGPAVWGPLIIKEAKQRFNIRSVVILGPNDQSGTDIGGQLAKMYSAQGVKVTTEYYQRGTTNFGPNAIRIMNDAPDAVELAATPTADVTLVVKQLTDAGFNGVYGALGGIGLTPVAQGAGGVQKINAYYWLELMPVDDPGARQLRVDYARVMKTGAPENALLYPSSTAAEQLLRAISLAGTDSDAGKIATALRSTTPESRYFGKGGWRGKAQYGINQELAFPVGMGVIADHKLIGVKRVDIPAE